MLVNIDSSTKKREYNNVMSEYDAIHYYLSVPLPWRPE